MIPHFSAMKTGEMLRLRAKSGATIYRPVPFDDAIGVIWNVYISRTKPVCILAYRNGFCEVLEQHRYTSKGNRLQIELPTNRRTRMGKVAYYQPKVSRLGKLAWGSLSHSPSLLVLHRNDNRSDDSDANTTVGTHGTNSEDFHDNRRSGVLCADDLVSVSIPRGLLDRIREKYGRSPSVAICRILETDLASS